MSQEWDLNRRVVIRKLPDNATNGEILDLFGKYGKINNIFIARNPPGFAFLEYVRRRDAELAVSKGNGKRCCGSHVSVELTIGDLDRTAVVRNLKRCPEKIKIRNVFGKFGRITRIWVERFLEKIAFVEYVHRSEATAAVRALNGKRFCGGIISVALPRNLSTQTTRPRYELRQIREPTIESSSSESNCENEQSLELESSSRDTRNCRELACDSTSSNQRLDCSICSRNTLENEPTSTVCGHIFCKLCLKNALQRAGKCPRSLLANKNNGLSKILKKSKAKIPLSVQLANFVSMRKQKSDGNNVDFDCP